MLLLVLALAIAFVLAIVGWFLGTQDDKPMTRALGVTCYFLAVIALFGGIALSSVYFVSSKHVGIVDKKFGGPTLTEGRIIAVNGENGIQAEVLRDGLHWWKFAWQLDIREVPVTQINPGQIGIVETKDGAPMPSNRVFAPEWNEKEVTNMLDANYFLSGKEGQTLPRGYKGPQLTVLGPGEYAVNTQLYTITPRPITEVEEGSVGVIKANTPEIPSTLKNVFESINIDEYIPYDPSKDPRVEAVRMLANLPTGDGIDEPTIADSLLDMVLPEGPLMYPPETVEPGKVGVWGIPIPPNKYWIHTDAFKVIPVNIRKQTIDFIGDTPTGEADTMAVRVKAKDGFEFNIDVSVIYHIEPKDAPGMVASVGDQIRMRDLVIQQVRKTLRDKVGETETLKYVNDRVRQQRIATKALAIALAPYGITVDDVNIRNMYDDRLAELLKTQSDREIAKQQEITYDQQKSAAEKQQELNAAEQAAVEERSLKTAEYDVKRQEQDKQKMIIQAEAEAEKVLINAKAEADAIALKGEAEAERYAKIVEALGATNITAIELMDLIKDEIGNIQTPDTLVIGGGDGSGEAISARILQLLSGEKTVNKQEK